ncbi:MAG: PEP-CTERM sorting domain-containing protein [Phycisphaera sp.]|nr:PEP-CTERM sorting domain-containing protein [Phycisphaera sp.]
MTRACLPTSATSHSTPPAKVTSSTDASASVPAIRALVSITALSSPTPYQAGEAGTVSITNSSLVKNTAVQNGVDLDVYVNDALVAVLSIDGFNSTTPTSFDGALGTLSVGDTVYVTVGNNGYSAQDAFVIDFTLESSAAIPEPASVAMGLAGLALVAVRRRR